MNLIGKIFVFVIVLLSILFMVLAMAVYSTHRNWKTAHATLVTENTRLKSDLQKLDSERKLAESNFQLKIDEEQRLNRELQSKSIVWTSEKKDINDEISALKGERSDLDAAVTSTQANNERLAKENIDLQKGIITAQEASDRAFQTTVQATAELHDANVKFDNEQQLAAQLTEQVAGMTMAMREGGLDPNTRVGDVKPRVGGFVSMVRRQAGAETIELTIGSDDGLKPGHTVEVYRTTTTPAQSKYLGRAEVLQTDGDRAYARIIPDLKKGRIQEGDRVATRLN